MTGYRDQRNLIIASWRCLAGQKISRIKFSDLDNTAKMKTTKTKYIYITIQQSTGAANNHVTEFFQDWRIFVFSDNLGYYLLKNAQYPNLWRPCGGIWSNSVILSFMGKYSSRRLVFFCLWPIPFELLTVITWNLV